jgi:hypothetical protein
LLEDAEEFVTTEQLHASFHSPALARPIEIVADAVRRNVTCRCSIGAPQDRRRYQSRMSWLLEQLPESSLGAAACLRVSGRPAVWSSARTNRKGEGVYWKVNVGELKRPVPAIRSVLNRTSGLAH